MPVKKPDVQPGKMYTQLMKLGYKNNRIKQMTFPGSNKSSLNLYSIGDSSSKSGQKEWRLRNNKGVRLNYPSKINIRWRSPENMKKFKQKYGTRYLNKMTYIWKTLLFCLGMVFWLLRHQHKEWVLTHEGQQMIDFYSESKIIKGIHMLSQVPQMIDALGNFSPETHALLAEYGSHLMNIALPIALSSGSVSRTGGFNQFILTAIGLRGATGVMNYKLNKTLGLTKAFRSMLTTTKVITGKNRPLTEVEKAQLEVNMHKLLGFCSSMGLLSGLNLLVLMFNEQIDFFFESGPFYPVFLHPMTYNFLARLYMEYVEVYNDIIPPPNWLRKRVGEYFESGFSRFKKTSALKNCGQFTWNTYHANQEKLKERKKEAAAILKFVGRRDRTENQQRRINKFISHENESYKKILLSSPNYLRSYLETNKSMNITLKLITNAHQKCVPKLQTDTSART